MGGGGGGGGGERKERRDGKRMCEVGFVTFLPTTK